MAAESPPLRRTCPGCDGETPMPITSVHSAGLCLACIMKGDQR